MDPGLKGKCALVAGGSMGIGRAAAMALAAEGCHAAICARGPEALEQAAGENRISGLRILAAAALLYAPPVLAKTGNFLPMLLSFLFAVPVLLLVPVIALACGRQEWKHKLPWILASLAVAILSFASLWWATQTYSLLARSDWYIIYLWVVPAFILWPVARKRLNAFMTH